MSELSIVLDLRLLGKMWHGTRDEQTPQPVRMTLGNKGALHLPSPCFQWSFLFDFHCWCALVYPRAATGHPVNMESMLFSFVLLFWLVIAVLLSYMAFRSLPIWPGLHFHVSSGVGEKWLYVFLDTQGWRHSCSYVTQLCVVLVVANDHQLSPSVLHWLEWLPNSSLPSLAACIHTDFLPRPQPDANWQQPANRGGTWAADLHFKEAEQRSPAGRHGQHRHCGTQVIILHIPTQRCCILAKRDTKSRRRDKTTQDHAWLFGQNEYVG